MQISATDRRLCYDNARKVCEKNGINFEGANPSFSYLRLETDMKDGQNSYQFPVLVDNQNGGQTQLPVEKRLNQQDALVGASCAFFIYFYNKQTGKPVTRLISGFTPWNAAALYLEAYSPAWRVFAGGPDTWRNEAGVPNIPDIYAGTNAMNSWWESSYVEYTSNYQKVAPAWDLLQHFYIPQTQATYPTNYVNGESISSFPYPDTVQQVDGSSDGWAPIEPNIVINGARNTQINLINPLAPSFQAMGWTFVAEPAGYDITPRLVMMYRGVLLQNVTNLK